jgi:hypothetical protein
MLMVCCIGCSTVPKSIEKESAMNVKRENGRVWIEGIDGFSTSQYASSPHGYQARILESLGGRIGYDDLICYSGFAFRLGVHKQMCPSAAHPWCGFVCIEGAVRALPWKTQIFEATSQSEAKEDRAALETKACAAIKDSIDRGIPVHYGSEEDGLIIGYANEGRRWWCVHPYHQSSGGFWHDEAEGFAGGKWPWGIVVWTKPKASDELVSDRDLTVAALEQAVEMWNTEKRGDYFVGHAAYAHWLSWLGDVESGRIDDPRGGMQGNAWCFDVLIHSRRIAGRWLKKKVNDFEGKAASELGIAADHYAQIADSCSKDFKSSWDLAVGPDRFSEWTSELRQTQIRRLEAAREHDQAAIGAIERALESLK